MKKYTLHRLLLLILSVIVFCPSLIFTQDINNLWEEYIQSETQLQQLQQKESAYLEHRNSLLERQEHLRNKQSWFNGWIVEMQLAGVSKSLVEIADSLEVFHRRVLNMQYQRDSSFNEFKHTYQMMLSLEDQSTRSSVIAEERSVVLARALINMEIPMGIFPDYTAILDELYEDENVKALVFRDLHTLIERKLALLDTLISERQMDLALLNRLTEFHQDLAAQMESNTDFNNQRSLTDMERAEGLSNDDIYRDRLAFVGISNWYDPQEYDPIPSENIMTEPTQYPGEQQVSTGTGAETISNDINLLEQKRDSYRELLEKIRKELSN